MTDPQQPAAPEPGDTPTPAADAVTPAKKAAAKQAPAKKAPAKKAAAKKVPAKKAPAKKAAAKQAPAKKAPAKKAPGGPAGRASTAPPKSAPPTDDGQQALPLEEPEVPAPPATPATPTPLAPPTPPSAPAPDPVPAEQATVDAVAEADSRQASFHQLRSGAPTELPTPDRTVPIALTALIGVLVALLVLRRRRRS
ncbi:hypothetical protein QSJ18_01350 [Gordonia sp. ABSL1-1]|uniref:hypothetical protein n=1 Tax=Gordonia sp. ABSL1-1 TaxID=3053923 RepID=UPI0025728A8C|nr:hypothetical protein [Gordonia sp. ABSL1-1]MDL9935382.1 hypothetical protein [Gordonia sp. ABSL1-1]